MNFPHCRFDGVRDVLEARDMTADGIRSALRTTRECLIHDRGNPAMPMEEWRDRLNRFNQSVAWFEDGNGCLFSAVRWLRECWKGN